MRSILALVLALLVLAAYVPGIFTETPVCAAVDGKEALVRVPARAADAKSCCGSPSCPMHAAGACGKAKACPKTGDGPSLCAPSCGREGARVAPGVPDPGTFDPTRAPVTLTFESRAARPALRDRTSQTPAPADPPPRS